MALFDGVLLRVKKLVYQRFCVLKNTQWSYWLLWKKVKVNIVLRRENVNKTTEYSPRLNIVVHVEKQVTSYKWNSILTEGCQCGILEIPLSREIQHRKVSL